MVICRVEKDKWDIFCWKRVEWENFHVGNCLMSKSRLERLGVGIYRVEKSCVNVGWEIVELIIYRVGKRQIGNCLVETC